jgi:hypothetical protein
VCLSQLHQSPVPEVQAAFARTLGWLGLKPDKGTPLDTLPLASVDEQARAGAAAALGCLLARHPRPWTASLAVDLNYRAVTASLFSLDGRGLLHWL